MAMKSCKSPSKYDVTQKSQIRKIQVKQNTQNKGKCEIHTLLDTN